MAELGSKPLEGLTVFLVRWYPNRYDPPLSVFIQKHAQAVAGYTPVHVVYVAPHEQAGLPISQETQQVGLLTETRIFYPRHKGRLSKVRQAWSWFSLNLSFIHSLHRRQPIGRFHAHMMLRTGLLALFCHWWWRKPFFLTEHWTGYQSGAYDQLSAWKKSLYGLVFRKARQVSVVSIGLEKAIQAHQLRDRALIIPNVVTRAPALPPQNQQEALFHWLSVSDFYDAKKNITGLLRVVDQLAQIRQDFQLHLVGDGMDRDQIDRTLQSCHALQPLLRRYGRLDNPAVLELMQQTDAYVCFSNIETFSVSCAEALVAGKPVVATRCGGPEFFVQAETGILIPVQDEDALLAGMQKIMNHYASYQNPAAFDRIRQTFQAAEIGRQFLQMYTGEHH